MKRLHFSFLLILTILVFQSCKEEPKMDYSFFVAGHAYGDPNKPQHGLYPPLIKASDYINKYKGMSLGVLTGDVVLQSTKEYWDAAFKDFDSFKFTLHIAAGNHDRGPVFKNYFKGYFYSFKNQNDLFIVLSPTEWNIEGKQKDFLVKTLKDNSPYVNNIFIFSHELIWWSPENKYKNVEINYRPHYPGSSNYWDEIHPLLNDLPNQVTIFAGDLGAAQNVSSFMYDKEDNVSFIASGMGGGKQDNIILVEVYPEEVKYKVIGLNKEPFNEMIDINQYELP